MCLARIDGSIRPMHYGYSVMTKDSNGYGSLFIAREIHFVIGKKYLASKNPTITREGAKYMSGFHVFNSKRDARVYLQWIKKFNPYNDYEYCIVYSKLDGDKLTGVNFISHNRSTQITQYGNVTVCSERTILNEVV